ncbi:MAG: hypothetical protein UT61_C0012G0018 [Candidatus Woesebacteria bacterium GW2011_GWA1_39_8]|jgi:RNA polymerase-interacting CarD/CdnL/TRCF family regulator|uniref:CarD C-terminal domain-containing protein n=1 Tax=Candidatus Woesebacteria bacterium GW2011_GWA1_39_8 TaxID=1618552 RepID=A0A0G0PQH9_9BACT|nr:MAG: hypothetical protein UT61_C0012G0018 [Candidatus Woesebacteria bacterium GW2011_GWA1_39_8]
MTKSKKLKVGDKFIERGKVYRIFKIEKATYEGKTERLIHYCPHYKNSLNKTLVCSIPESSLIISNIRTPIPKKEITELLGRLAKRSKKKKVYDVDEAKLTLNLNDIYKTADVLRKYWRKKNKDIESFTKVQKDVLEMAMNRLVEEVALVKGLSLTDAEDKIITTLKD